MARSLSDSSTAARNWRKRGASLMLAALIALTMAPAAQAATSTNAWLARIGTAGANGTATVQAFTTGTGTIALKLARLRASSTLAVTLLKASCRGATLATLASIRTTSRGAATRTSSLTAAQVTAIKKATAGTGKFAVRVGTGTTAKCGVFVVQSVPAYLAATVTVGRAPSGVAIDPTGVWVTNWWDNTLSKINPATNTVLSVVPVTLEGTEGPEAITTGGGSLWMTTSEFSDTDTLAGSVLRIDPATGTVLANIPGGRGAYSIVYGLGAVWVANVMDGNVQRIDPATNAVTATIPITGAVGVGVDATAVWVAGVTGTVPRIDPATNMIVATIHTQATAANIAVGNGSIWVTHPGTKDAGNGSVSRINPATNQVVANILLGDQPFAISAAGGSIWVGLYTVPSVIRINPATNTILSRLTVSSGIYALAATDHAVWTAHNVALPEGATEPPLGRSRAWATEREPSPSTHPGRRPGTALRPCAAPLLGVRERRQVDPGRPRPGGHATLRPAEQVALPERHRERPERIQLRGGLDSFGDQAEPALRGEVAHAGNERLAGGLLVHAPDEGEVDLHEVRGELQDMAEARVPGTGVVDGQANRGAKLPELAAQPLVVVDRDVLGDLEDDRSIEAGQEPAQAAGEDQLG